MEKQKCIIYSNIKATSPNIKIIHKNIIEKIKKMGVLGHPKKPYYTLQKHNATTKFHNYNSDGW